VIAISRVATYAAIVATAAFAWQAYSWIVEHRSRIEVHLHLGSSVTVDGAFGGHLLMLTVINHSADPLDVEAVGFAVMDGTGRVHPIDQPPDASLPGRIEPRHRGETWVRVTELRAQLGGVAIRALADAADGTRHLSKTFTL
jgi:hypothetical protein